jgi:hypothetical protein
VTRLWVGALLAAFAGGVGLAAADVGVPKGPPFAFGGVAAHGPYTVTIDASGLVRATGNGGLSRLGVSHLGRPQVAELNRVARAARFGSLPALTRCPAAQANSTTWVSIGSKKVTVHGACLPAYQRVFKTLVATVHFFSSG